MLFFLKKIARVENFLPTVRFDALEKARSNVRCLASPQKPVTESG
jgi:hypothetical protein